MELIIIISAPVWRLILIATLILKPVTAIVIPILNKMTLQVGIMGGAAHATRTIAEVAMV